MLIVNLFGGPGCGKSTGAAYVFTRLKEAGVNCELVTEFAKDLVWDGRKDELADQVLVFAVQRHRLNRLRGKVDVVVTDSPLLLSAVYYRDGQDIDEEFGALVTKSHFENPSLNVFVKRTKPYQKTGRNESEAEAKEKDDEIRYLFEKFLKGELRMTVDGMSTGYEEVVQKVLKEVRK